MSEFNQFTNDNNVKQPPQYLSTYTSPSNFGNSQQQPASAFDADNSSRRSSLASYDSRGSGSSPRASVAFPPPPYDPHRHNSPVHVIISGSPRSSFDSRHISPRGSIVSGVTFDRYPIIRQQNNGNPVQTGPIYRDKYNEMAPPILPDGGRKRANDSRSIVINNSQSSKFVPVVARGGNQNVSVLSTANGGMHINVTISAADGKNTVSPITRLPGLHYDIVPPKQCGPSEAERKLAALTEQLENEMKLSSGNKRSSVESPSNSHEPPPYPQNSVQPITVQHFSEPTASTVRPSQLKLQTQEDGRISSSIHMPAFKEQGDMEKKGEQNDNFDQHIENSSADYFGKKI